jgi:propanol-preferring alcohol dehydrogenase
MLLQALGPLTANSVPLVMAIAPTPVPAAGEVLIRITACAVCHTELDEIEGRTRPPQLPVIPGHQVIGIVQYGPHAGTRVGVAWIHSACGRCSFCLAGKENLCEAFQATGRDANGGYAQFMTIGANFFHPIPESLSDSEAAPLLCAGAVGYRALKLTGLSDGEVLGLAGFGASNHLVLMTARHQYPRSPVFVFSRNAQERDLALTLGAAWAGAMDDKPPEWLDGAIDATPAWKPIMQCLRHLRPGGRLVINAIRKEEADKKTLLALDYSSQLWMEREIKSVANVTRQDVREFLQLAADAQIRPEFEEYPLEDANRALIDVKQGRIRGAKVLRVA